MPWWRPTLANSGTILAGLGSPRFVVQLVLGLIFIVFEALFVTQSQLSPPPPPSSFVQTVSSTALPSCAASNATSGVVRNVVLANIIGSQLPDIVAACGHSIFYMESIGTVGGSVAWGPPFSVANLTGLKAVGVAFIDGDNDGDIVAVAQLVNGVSAGRPRVRHALDAGAAPMPTRQSLCVWLVGGVLAEGAPPTFAQLQVGYPMWHPVTMVLADVNQASCAASDVCLTPARLFCSRVPGTVPPPGPLTWLRIVGSRLRCDWTPTPPSLSRMA
jgi:hypothetical protein